MANYRKSFNLRNGVQVDNTNFVVNANGLVGIGTSSPNEVLDVRGNAKIVGFITANTLYAGIATVGILSARQGIVVSAAVTATAFYGDGTTLSNIVGYSTAAWIVNIPRTGISTTLNVGIGTTVLSTYSLLIGSDPSFGGNGIGFDGASGNIRSTGILTSYSFSGFGTNISGLNASNIVSGTLSNSFLPSNINISGVVTATGGFRGNITGIASTALSLSGSPNITVTNISANNYNSSGILTTGTVNSGLTSVTSTQSSFLTAGITTINTSLYIAPLGTLGIGTNIPNADIHIRDANDGASIQLTSDGNNEAYIAIGRSVTRTQNNGELRFGNTNISQRFSTTSSLDVINYSLGNLNHYLNLGASGINTGNFNWIYGPTSNSPLMTLTYGGRLGIGITIPTDTLHVVGTSTVTGNSYVAGNFSVSGNLSVGGVIVTTNGINLNGTTLIGNVQGNLTGNVNASSGISTFNSLQITSSVGFSSVTTTGNVGIRTSASTTNPLTINNGGQAVIITSLGAIGLGTDTFTSAPSNAYNVSIDAARGVAYVLGIGAGTTTPASFADFSNAGLGVLSNAYQFMLPPKISTSTRAGLSTVEGALIYNITSRRLELFLGAGRGWVGIVTTP